MTEVCFSISFPSSRNLSIFSAFFLFSLSMWTLCLYSSKVFVTGGGGSISYIISYCKYGLSLRNSRKKKAYPSFSATALSSRFSSRTTIKHKCVKLHGCVLHWHVWKHHCWLLLTLLFLFKGWLDLTLCMDLVNSQGTINSCQFYKNKQS